MAVASGIIVGWPSTVASIPSGWTRETALDARYLRGAPTGADADLSTDRGNDTHTHNSPSHQPTQPAHAHSFTFSSFTAIEWASTPTPRNTVAQTHGHSASTGTETTAITDGMSITVDATANDPAYLAVIWIKSNGSPAGIPVGALAFFVSDTLPTNWTRQAGDKFLKGAAASGDGGGTGGAATHTHTSPAHTHTAQSHVHTGNVTGASTGATNQISGTDVVDFSPGAHTHTFNLTAATQTVNSVTTTIDSANGEPPWRKMNTIKNETGGDSLPTNLIAVWGSTVASIPSGWARFTNLDDKFVKGANANGESDTSTGGSSQHNHTASNCAPTTVTHNHPGTTAWATVETPVIATDVASPGSGRRGALTTHAHTTSILNDGGLTHNPVAVTIDNCTSEAAWPKYRRVIYVEFSGGAQTHEAQASLAGAGTLTLAAVATYAAAAVLPGTGTLILLAQADYAAAAALVGTGTMAAAGVATYAAAAALDGVATLVAVGTVGVGEILGAASLLGTATVAAVGSYLQMGAATLAGTATVAVVGTFWQFGAAILTGTGVVAGLAVATWAAAAQMAGLGFLAPYATADWVAKAGLIGQGFLGATDSTHAPPKTVPLRPYVLHELYWREGVGKRTGRLPNVTDV